MRFSATSALLALAGHAAADLDLHSLAVAAGKSYFGTATDNNELSDGSYTAITKLASNFGSITPGNGQKWDFVEKTQGVFTYTYADVVPNFAKANNQLLRCHTLLYRSQTPTWVTSGSWSKAQMTSIIKTHIENVVGHYKGQCYSWDVVNEAVGDDGEYRETVFYKVLGLDHITLAFNTAHEVDPAAKLYYNDYNIENPNAKQKKTVELVKYLQDAGAPIHGVGLQGHFIVGSMPSQTDLEAVVTEFVGMDVDVAYTELDIKFSSLPYTSAGLETQAEAYAAVINACLNVERCVGWTVWDWTDKYSWVPGTFPGQGGACLFDDKLKPKPAYSAVSSALAAAATKGSSTKVSSTVAATANPTAVSSKASSAVVSASTSELPKSSSAAVVNTTTTQAAPNTSGAIVSATSIPFSSASRGLKATAIFPNGTATATGPAGGITTLTGILTTATPGSVATLTLSNGEVITVPGTLPGNAETTPVPSNAPAPNPSSGNGAGDAPSYTVSTVYTTNIYTVTSCAPTVADCPAKLGSPTTEVAAFTTTVLVPSAAPISKCERKRRLRQQRRQARLAQRAVQKA